MKWETGNVININGISSAFDWDRNWIRLRKLGWIVNSVPSLLRDSYAFMPRLTPKCWIKHIAADNYLIPHSILRLYACNCLVWNFIHKKWFVSHLSRGKLRTLSLLQIRQQKPHISLRVNATSSTWTKVSLSFLSIFGVGRSVIVRGRR